MKRDDFKTSVTNQSPSEELPKPLTALWWQKKGDWDQAHVIVQSDKTEDGAWVHALLHREEGDLGNASYWYLRANKIMPKETIESEWELIVSELLNR